MDRTSRQHEYRSDRIQQHSWDTGYCSCFTNVWIYWSCWSGTAVETCWVLSVCTSMLRAQTYDGEANMDGKYNGCQAVIHERHPLALHFRCASDSIHLIAQHATEADVCPCSRLFAVGTRTGKNVQEVHKMSSHVWDHCCWRWRSTAGYSTLICRTFQTLWL